MANALQKHCGEVVILGPSPLMEAEDAGADTSLPGNPGLQEKVDSRQDSMRSLATAMAHARHFEARISGEALDWIYAPQAAVELACLNTSIPVIYSSDSTLQLLRGYYENFSNLARFDEADELERKAIHKATVLVYRSSWAASSAIRDYGADPSRIHVLPTGANVDTAPDRSAVLGRKKGLICRLLFVGVDWKRKGGFLAYKTMVLMNESGLKTELIVCGCLPAESVVNSDPRVTVVPYRDKNTPVHLQMMENLFWACDFFFVPTRADCLMNSICEAGAYGLPSISTDTGGVSFALTHGKNGFLLPPTADENDYASLITELFQDDERYSALVRSSRSEFETRLNWDVWGSMMAGILGTALR